jgi:hypothetical protein
MEGVRPVTVTWKTVATVLGVTTAIFGNIWFLATTRAEDMEQVRVLSRQVAQTDKRVERVAATLEQEIQLRRAGDAEMRDEYIQRLHRLENAMTFYHGARPALPD